MECKKIEDSHPSSRHCADGISHDTVSASCDTTTLLPSRPGGTSPQPSPSDHTDVDVVHDPRHHGKTLDLHYEGSSPYSYHKAFHVSNQYDQRDKHGRAPGEKRRSLYRTMYNYSPVSKRRKVSDHDVQISVDDISPESSEDEETRMPNRLRLETTSRSHLDGPQGHDGYGSRSSAPEDMGYGSRSKVPEDVRLRINSRERQRMHDINSALDGLRQVMPYSSGPSVKKLSKMSTLLLARNYILMLTQSLAEMRRVIQELSTGSRLAVAPPIPAMRLEPPTAFSHLLPAHHVSPPPGVAVLPSPLLHPSPAQTHQVTSHSVMTCPCARCQKKRAEIATSLNS